MDAFGPRDSLILHLGKKFKAPFFFVAVLALLCGPWQCNASRFFSIKLYLSFTFAIYSDGDQEQISSIRKLVYAIQ